METAQFALDFTIAHDLGILFEQLNREYWQGKLPRYRCEWSSRMLSTWGCCYPHLSLIRISTLFQSRPMDEVIAVLKHEMVHIRYRGHGPAFHRELQRVGLPRDVQGHFPHLNGLTHSRRRPLRYSYECPNCGVKIQRRKRIRGYCVVCYDRGVTSRFRLKDATPVRKKSRPSTGK